jgi:uncharacterized protein YdaU (DUF1376 family)
MNFYPFHIGDYISHTHHLSDAEDLAYRRMIDLYYQRECGFISAEWVARKIKSTPEITKSILEEFFEFNNDLGYWANPRADEEIAKYHAMQAGGRKGASIRWGKGSNSPPNATPMQTKNQEPLTKNHNIESAKAPKAQRLKIDALPQEWAEFCKKERPDIKPDAIWNQFKDYWIAQGGQKGAKLDWFATWRNWVRNQKQITVYTQDKPTQRWDATLEGIMTKGRELGILPKPGETEGQYRERVKQG